MTKTDRAVIYVSRDLHHQLKILAAHASMTVGEIAELLIKQSIKRNEGGQDDERPE